MGGSFIINLITVFILLVLIIVLITLIVSVFMNWYGYTTFNNYKITNKYLISPENEKNIQIESVGKLYGVTRFRFTSKVMSHQDLILKDINDNYYILVLLFTDPNGANNIYDLSCIKLDSETIKQKKFIIRDFPYYYDNFYKISGGTLDLYSIHKLYNEIVSLPYNFITFNCHHRANMMLNILTGMKKNTVYSNWFKPISVLYMNYIYQPIQTVF